MRGIFAAVAVLIFLAPSSARATVPTVDAPVAVLRALDKNTARVEVLDVPVNKPVSFGALMITARTCRTTLPEETPESAAFLEVSELQPGKNEAPVFRGWMFASSPALSALEHPVYDIWLIGCKASGAATAAP